MDERDKKDAEQQPEREQVAERAEQELKDLPTDEREAEKVKGGVVGPCDRSSR